MHVGRQVEVTAMVAVMLMVDPLPHSVDVSAVLNKGVDDLGDTANTLQCAVIGDIFNTLLYSPCNTGKHRPPPDCLVGAENY